MPDSSSSTPIAETDSIPEKDRVPVPQKVAFGFGIVSDHLATFSINAFAMPIFNIFLHLSPTLIGVALMIARLWDAFSDPMVGSLSDNCKHPKGRRKPYVFWGAIATGLFFPFLWLAPESWGETGIFIYLTAALLIYFTCYSVFSVPYQSLGMELTSDYRERTNVYSTMAYIQQVSGLLVPWLLAITTWSIFPDKLVGTQIVSIGVGILIVAAGIMPALYCQEKFGKVAKNQKFENPLKSLWAFRNNKPLLLIFSAIGVYLLAVSTTQALDVHVNTYYIYDGDIDSGSTLFGIDGTLRVVFAFIGAFIMQRYSKKIDKRSMILACVTVIFICKFSVIVTYIPGKPYFILLSKPFLAMAETGFWILILSMRADVADYDELEFGRRREGVIAAVGNWLAKMAMTIAMGLSGLVLEHIAGFEVSLGGDQAPGTLDRLIWCYTLIPTAAAAIMFLLMYKYPLTHTRMTEIRAKLEMRREAV